MKVKLFDISWQPYDIESFNQLFIDQINNNKKLTVAYINIHGIYLYYRTQQLRDYINSSVIDIDGMPIIWLLRLNGYKLSPRYRITWVDWMVPLLSFCMSNNIKVFYVGGKPGVAERGLNNIAKSLPGLVFETNDGYFQIDPVEHIENISVINRINNFEAQMIIVGMGMGRQEKWILENKDKLNANVIITAGAAAEYFAGEVNSPPRWMGRVGLEWLFRFLENPKRFWYRYLIEPWFILSLYFRKKN